MNDSHDNTNLNGRHYIKIESLDLTKSVGSLRERAGEYVKGESAGIERAKQLIVEAAPTRSTVLIYGETGTGKEPVANAIHYCSDRRDKKFEPMNCASVPEHLLEDELFGHEKGAFTGAHSVRQGRFEHADGGTLFLDEIGEMSLELQAKLLRVLQERKFERLGSSRSIKTDVRILAATNRDLKGAIREGRFRADLYYRLAVVEIYLPPLRERRSDIPILVPHLLQKKQISAGWRQLVSFTPEGFEALCSVRYDWPGNVRELENKIERLGMSASAGTGFITKDAVLDMFDDYLQSTAKGEVPNASRKSANEYQRIQEREIYVKARNEERNRYIQALLKTNGNKSKAARLLGIDRSTFRARLRRLMVETESVMDP